MTSPDAVAKLVAEFNIPWRRASDLMIIWTNKFEENENSPRATPINVYEAVASSLRLKIKAGIKS